MRAVFALTLSGQRTIDHPLLMLACLAYMLFAWVWLWYWGMGEEFDDPARRRRFRRLHRGVTLGFFVALGVFFALATTGVHNVPGR